MNKTIMFGLLALVVVGIVVSTGLVSAYRGDYEQKGPNYNEERHDEMQSAFDNLDYAAWYDLMTQDERRPRVVDVVTEDNFATFVQAHEAMIGGDVETARTLRAELGLNDGFGPRHGAGNGKMMGQRQGQRLQQNFFIDANGDGVCDNQ